MKEKWGSNVKLDKVDNNTDSTYFSALPKSSENLPGFTHGKKPSWSIRKDGKKSGVKA
jgi:hypothetical protein